MSAGVWLEQATLNHFFRNTPVVPPSQLFLALYFSDPTDDDVGAEIQGGAYTRQIITFSEPVRTAEGGSIIFNDTEIRFPVATSNWGTISHFAIRTAATGGLMLAHAPVPVPRLIENGDEAKFHSGTLIVRMR